MTRWWEPRAGSQWRLDESTDIGARFGPGRKDAVVRQRQHTPPEAKTPTAGPYASASSPVHAAQPLACRPTRLMDTPCALRSLFAEGVRSAPRPVAFIDREPPFGGKDASVNPTELGRPAARRHTDPKRGLAMTPPVIPVRAVDDGRRWSIEGLAGPRRQQRNPNPRRYSDHAMTRPGQLIRAHTCERRAPSPTLVEHNTDSGVIMVQATGLHTATQTTAGHPRNRSGRRHHAASDVEGSRDHRLPPACGSPQATLAAPRPGSWWRLRETPAETPRLFPAQPDPESRLSRGHVGPGVVCPRPAPTQGAHR